MRIGHGYDVHKLVDDRKLILGGVLVDHTKGLLGHSDADVLVHSIIDALLGAAALGDIGLLFPDNDEQYKNISSIKLLEYTIMLLNKNNFSIGNIDCTIIAQEPKLRSYITQITEQLAKVCDINISQINIKATTEEGLGFTGEKLGISSHCVCIIE